MKQIRWSSTISSTAIIDQCSNTVINGGVAVTPTKVGYIIIATNRQGLEKKFELKGRPQTKPSVILCPDVSMVKLLAETNPAIDKLYESCWEREILLGCILPWKKTAYHQYIPKDNSGALITDKNNTSCFVIKFGTPSEIITRHIWGRHGLLTFASSANPSGTGNKGRLMGVGERILNGAEIVVEADDYVHKQQLGKDINTRYEQGVMVSMVDKTGELSDMPTIIRKGLELNQITIALSEIYNKFDYRHGQYC